MIFSVIIPTYNRAETVAETVRSVLGQTFGDFEIIVVDDGGSDNTAELLAALNDPRIKYFYKKNEERAVARNYGAALASGMYLNFVDSDDLMQPHHLASVHQFLEKTRYEPRMVFTGYTVVDENGNEIYRYGLTGIFPFKKLLYGNHLLNIALIVEKKAFMTEQYNTDRRIIVLEDWELWLRLLSHHKVHCIPAFSIAAVNHSGRSVLSSNADGLITKVNAMREISFRDAPMVSRSWRARRTLSMGLFSYASLHMALAGEKRSKVIHYLIKALRSDPCLLLKKRFYAIVRRLF